MSVVYLNGKYLPRGEARVSVDDRGFLFSDGIYEVTPAYGGRFFRLPHHLCRMRGGLDALRIDYSVGAVEAIHHELLTRNGLLDREVATVYFQVTRGVAPRTHAFPADAVPPTVFASAAPFTRPERDVWEDGFSAITVPDRRWARADLKTIGLLPNVLAQQAAVEAGVKDALLVRDGVAVEGAHNNVFFVVDGRLVTHPTTHQILPGITRAFVLELARSEGIPVVERPFQVEELHTATELFFTGTTTEIRPTVRLDGRPVGEGRVGPVARRLDELFRRAVQREVAGAQG